MSSVKFERETVREAPIPGDRKHEFAHKVGERLTGGETKTGYLQVRKTSSRTRLSTERVQQAYLDQLEKNPLRTKMLTSGSLAGLQEVLASWIAKDVSKHGHYFSSRVPKMAAYGAFISAPMGHFLIKILHWLFSGKTSLKSKIAQILVSNLFVSFSLQSLRTLLGVASRACLKPPLWY